MFQFNFLTKKKTTETLTEKLKLQNGGLSVVVTNRCQTNINPRDCDMNF